jgi:hypothetical protein
VTPILKLVVAGGGVVGGGVVGGGVVGGGVVGGVAEYAIDTSLAHALPLTFVRTL